MAKRGQGEGTISKRPDGTWWARITVGKTADGKQKRKAFYGKTRKEVQEKLTAAVNDVNAGTYIEPSKMTLGQWMDIWLEEYKKRSCRPTTYSRTYQSYINHIKPQLGMIIIKDIRSEDIQRFCNSLFDKGMGRGSVDVAISALHSALEQACVNEMIPKNVAKGIVKANIPKKKTDVLTKEEQRRFVEAAKENPHGELFIIPLYTGMRIGETLALNWKKIDFDKQIILINEAQREYRDFIDANGAKKRERSKPKTKSSIRIIPMLPQISALLVEMKNNNIGNKDGYIFTTPEGEMLPRSTYDKWFRKILDAAGIEKDGIHIHSLRHTFATRGLENGIEMKVMQELLGHHSITMTADVYSHVLPEKKFDSLSRLDDIAGYL